MQQHKVLQGQTIFDVALIYFGDISKFWQIAQANNLNITDELQSGTIIQIPNLTIDSDSKKIANYFQTRNALLPIATNAQLSVSEGIENWAIEYDFVIS